MRTVTEQLDLVLSAALTPPPVRVAISEAQGLLCAEEVVATAALPAFDQAAVDGYAVRSVDIHNASASAPVTLPIVGTIEAGTRLAHRLQPHQCVYVATGAPLPIIADTVVPRSTTDRSGARVTVTTSLPSGRYVRRTGEDVQPGDVAVRSGAFIGAAQVGLLAAVGRDKVLVHPRPRLSIVTVGDELVDVSRTPGPGQVFDVNSYALAAAARDAGAEVNRVGIAPHDLRRLRELVEARLLVSELVVIAGAAGGHSAELVVEALSELGDLDLTRVAMQPGSAQGFGRLGPDRVPTFLLPMNPVSALVVFEVIVRPVVRVMLGRRNPYRRTVAARTLEPITSPPGRRQFLRGQLLRDENDDYLVHVLGGGGTHLLASLAEANCLVLVDEDATSIPVGSEVAVSFLAQRA
ncbi:molybdotransferase-like divisome protein Glp [Nakamurella endophytica]|uniref:Molybdopterin molybdenumtransferase n=1 Tax=Nakamurella endophytica TaxID=1748367 RepID=A0A917SL70_9ACTN|nr:gephyrin-like molybdotransferase Glp [Nakamurella endophytica]GGL88184.1 molybdopterin molybdenumtransferase [Nakamurella endophytica]